MSYNVRNPEIEARMKDMILRLSSGLPEGWGVTIMIFTFGGEAQCSIVRLLSATQ
jgi:hypothetical protein